MHSDPATTTHTDSTYFSFLSFHGRIDPYTRFTFGAVSNDTIFLQCEHYDFFNVSKVFAYICSEMLKIENGVSYNLPGAMKSDVSSPVSPEKLDPFCRSHFIIDKDVFHTPTL